jgi:hypothetical protein
MGSLPGLREQLAGVFRESADTLLGGTVSQLLQARNTGAIDAGAGLLRG